MSEELKIGDRVQLTEEARKQFPRGTGKGVVENISGPNGKQNVRPMRYGLIRVICDGAKNGSTWGITWWEKEKI